MAETKTLPDRFYRCLQALLDEGLLRRSQDITLKMLSAPESIVVDTIGTRGPFSMSGLAKACGSLPNTMTGIVDRLVRRGVLQRLLSEEDRRLVLVSLTDLGRQMQANHQQFLHEYASGLLKRLARNEQKDLVHLLERVTVPASE
jgi:DNA-binding MarR family transcriptional regulator